MADAMESMGVDVPGEDVAIRAVDFGCCVPVHTVMTNSGKKPMGTPVYMVGGLGGRVERGAGDGAGKM